MKKSKKEKLADKLIGIFGAIGIFGWFPAIWIDEYRWKLMWTTFVCLMIAILISASDKARRERDE